MQKKVHYFLIKLVIKIMEDCILEDITDFILIC